VEPVPDPLPDIVRAEFLQGRLPRGKEGIGSNG
jgi:hypothetical protein